MLSSIQKISLMQGENIIELPPGDIDIHLKTLSRLVRALAALESTVAN
jgi:hypothetical protein